MRPASSKPTRQSAAEVVALAGQNEIVVAIEPDLAGRAGDARAERGDRRPGAGLALLAAEAAAHAPRLDRHEGVGNAQDARDDVLHLGRVLRRGMDDHLDALAGNGERDLALRDRNAPGRRSANLPSSRCGAAASARLDVAAAEFIIGQNARAR